MAILSFGFNKILVEKKTKSAKQINIKSGLKITGLEPSGMIKDENQKAFLIKFSFTVDYEPNMGIISMDGDLIYLAPNKLAEELEKNWEKNNSLPQEVGLVVFNRILQNCNVEALILSRELNLPAPIQLPKVSAEPSTKKPTAKKNLPK